MSITHVFRRIGGLCLSVVLALNLCVSAGAAEQPDRAQSRQEDLDFLYDTLKAWHPNLFANTPESVFLERKSAIEARLETESDTDFTLDLQSLASLARDSHTQISIGGIAEEAHFYPFALSWFDGRWVLSTAVQSQQTLLGAAVTAVNGRTMAQTLEQFRMLLSADNDVKLRRQYRQSCNVAELYEYVGIAGPGQALTLTLKTAGGQVRTLSAEPLTAEDLMKESLSSLSEQRSAAPATAAENVCYLSKELNDTMYYIQYNRCQEDPQLPMEDFAAAVWSDLDTHAYQRVIVDLRNNGGGSDGVIWPLLEVLRDFAARENQQILCLIGETTFSSAIINAVELQEMGAVLVGEPTSGSVDHFGSVKSFVLPNSGIQAGVSSKYMDLGTLLDAAAGKGVEPLMPDIAAPQTLEDELAGKDSCLEYLTAHTEVLRQKERPEAPLTRGRFIGQIHQAAAPLFAGNSGVLDGSYDLPPFMDLLGIEWFLHPLNWAYQRGVALGSGDGTFSAAREITWQEATVFLIRAASALELRPDAVRAASLPAVLADGAWDRTALEQAWSWGLFPEGADFSKTPTQAQGLAMAQRLLSFA